MLDSMFRESWIIGKAIVVIPEDMTKNGIEFEGSWAADQITYFKRQMIRLRIWYDLQSALQWSRLYGGAVALMMIDGQDMSTPLRMDTIAAGQFKGLKIYDRWTIDPDLSTYIEEFGPSYGKPEYYITQYGEHETTQKIHHSRLLIFTGLELPYYEAERENGWGASMIEQLFDRLLAFDSTTQGAAQLVYRAYLRTIGIEDFREILAAGGPAEEALKKMLDWIRLMQVNEGLTIIDSKDTFQGHQYTFSGLDKVLLAFGEQLSGALGIPLVRLFGQSPAGLNSTGESDLRTYYDSIKATQEIDLRNPLLTLCDVMSRSLFGEPVPDDFWFNFAPLWDLSDSEKADIANKDATTITLAYDSGRIDQATAMRELKASSEITGRFDKIRDEDIEEAEAGPPSMEELEAQNTDPQPRGGDSPS